MGTRSVVTLKLTINGTDHEVASEPDTPLVYVLRDELKLKGTKLGCASGECGACTVIIDDRAVCACLMPVGRVGDRNVETIEGVGTVEAPHPLRKCHAGVCHWGEAERSDASGRPPGRTRKRRPCRGTCDLGRRRLL